MKFETYDLDKPGDYKPLFETDRKTVMIPIPNLERGHYVLELHEDGSLEIQSSHGGALLVYPRASNTIILKPGEQA